MTEPGAAPASRLAAWRNRDHVRGSLGGSLFVLALPALATSLLGGVVFQLADLTFLSRLGEAPLAAAIIVNQTLRQVVMMTVMGIAFATQALVARAVGEGRPENAEHVAGQVLLLGACLALVVALAGALFAEPLFAIVRPDESFVPYGVPYLRLAYLLSFGLVGAQLFAAILTGAGDTTTPLVVMLAQTAIAIFGEWVLIFGNLGFPALGVRGAALGIAAGQVAAAALGFVVLLRGRARVHLRGRHLVPDPAALARIARLSWPPALQLGVTTIVIVVYLRLAGRFGDDVQAAYAIGLRLGMIAPMVSFPIAGACATLVGQALGAGDPRRAWRAIGVGLVAHGAVMWGFSLGFFFFRHQIMALLSDDPGVVEIGAEYLLFAAGACFFWAFYFVFLRALQGAGDMIVPMAISVGTTLFFSVPLAVYLSLGTDLGRVGLWTAFLASAVVTTVATGLRLATGRWTRRGAHWGPPPAEPAP